MVTFVAVLLCICTTIVISMWLCIGGQITNMYKRVDDIKRVVDHMPQDTTVGNYYIWLKDYIGTVNDHLTTEIACLATKNNEDIKRIKGDYQQWDMVEFDGEQWIIYKIDENVNGDTFYRVHNAKGQIGNVSSKEMQHATFVKHTSSPFDDRK